MENFSSGGKAIRLDVIEPASSDGATRSFPALLLVHGAGGNVGFWLERMAPFATRLGIAVYGVHYSDRTGTVHADMATINDGIHVPLWLDTIHDALTHISQRRGVDPDRVILVGVSLGAYLSLALATLQSQPAIRCIVEISGGLASPYAEGVTKSFPPTLILHGEQDTVVPASEAYALKAALDRVHVPVLFEVIPGEGHWFSFAAQLRMLGAIGAFLNLHLQTPAR